MDSSFEILQSLLRSPVGEYQDSDPDDVKQTRRNFNALGLESGDPERGYIDRELDTTIREFQRDMDLKEDGLMNPGGETERTLNDALHFVSTHTPLPHPQTQNPAFAGKEAVNTGRKRKKIGTIERKREICEKTF